MKLSSSVVLTLALPVLFLLIRNIREQNGVDFITLKAIQQSLIPTDVMIRSSTSSASLRDGENVSTASNPVISELPTDKQEATRNNGLPIVDFVSVGSMKLQDIQNAQHETFGSHKAARHFFRATEETDTEKNCHKDLTMDHLKKVVRFCKGRREWPVSLNQLRSGFARLQWLQKKKEPLGWMCAQKRPIDGFLKYVQTHGLRNESNLPDYLVIMDDDTWVGMDNLIDFVPNSYPIDEPRAIAGCMIRKRVHEQNFTFGFGGYGLVLNRMALFNFLRPLHCGNVTVAANPLEETDFEKLFCWRLNQNQVGELPLFRDGMSGADLMDAYTFDNAYLDVEKWSGDGVGFCMHSDWVFGYFINYYHLAKKHDHHPSFTGDVLTDRMEGYNLSEFYDGRQTAAHRGRLRECRNSNDFHEGEKNVFPNGDAYCGPKAHVCHRITSNRMRHLHNKTIELHPHDY
mmetsp:Transcript_7183/g.9319  ORF Transcript_7183/g.9319 Transcript_7183/m.9319 type:complete len:458 (+) Transcript_7183:81-1454(+)